MDHDDGYAGPAVLCAAGSESPVEVRLSGYVDPLDGRYHWGGRIRADERAAALLREGRRDVTLRIGGRDLPVRLTEADPWGGVLLSATGPPPWPAFTEPGAPPG